MSTRLFALVAALALVACGSTEKTANSGADASTTGSTVSTSITSTSPLDSPVTIVIENTSVSVRSLTDTVQLAGCLCKLVPFNATNPKTLSAPQLASSIESPLEFAGAHGTVEMMVGLFTDEVTAGFVDRPAWLLAVHDVLRVPSGPPDGPHIPEVGTVVYVYDAVTGASLVEFAYPEGSVTCPLPDSGTPDRCGIG